MAFARKKREVMKELAYYDGTIAAPEELKIPFNDRVHFFGDGVYDASVEEITASICWKTIWIVSIPVQMLSISGFPWKRRSLVSF